MITALESIVCAVSSVVERAAGPSCHRPPHVCILRNMAAAWKHEWNPLLRLCVVWTRRGADSLLALQSQWKMIAGGGGAVLLCSSGVALDVCRWCFDSPTPGWNITQWARPTCCSSQWDSSTSGCVQTHRSSWQLCRPRNISIRTDSLTQARKQPFNGLDCGVHDE